MITLLHGDNTDASRNALRAFKLARSGKDIRELIGKGLDGATLTQSLESSSLFGGDTLVIIENLFSSFSKSPKKLEPLLAMLIQSKDQADTILWEEKAVSPAMLKLLGPHAKVQLFSVPIVIFQFLDGLKPNNTKQIILLYHHAIEQNPVEVLFVMITRRLRQLIMIADHETPEGMKDWQAARLTSQSRLFTIEQLRTLYTAFSDAEYALKTGATPFTFEELIEQILITI